MNNYSNLFSLKNQYRKILRTRHIVLLQLTQLPKLINIYSVFIDDVWLTDPRNQRLSINSTANQCLTEIQYGIRKCARCCSKQTSGNCRETTREERENVNKNWSYICVFVLKKKYVVNCLHLCVSPSFPRKFIMLHSN